MSPPAAPPPAAEDQDATPRARTGDGVRERRARGDSGDGGAARPKAERRGGVLGAAVYWTAVNDGLRPASRNTKVGSGILRGTASTSSS